MDAETTKRLASFGTCFFCQRPLLTTYLKIPVTRGRTIYTARVHTACHNLAHSGLSGDAMQAARARQAQVQAGIEELYARMVAAGQAVKL